MLEAIITVILADPVKSLLGGTGVFGVVVLIVRWLRTWPRVFTRGFTETFNIKETATVEVQIQVELENHGRESTSLEPIVNLHCIYHEEGARKYKFTVLEQDRTLPPVTPKVFHLRAIVPAGYVFSHFRVFRFSLSRGFAARIRILNASGQSAGMLKFTALKALYRVFGALPHVRG